MFCRTISRSSRDVGTNRDAHQMHSGHHDLTSREVPKLEQLVQNPPRLTAQQAAGLTLLDDELQLLRCVITLRVDLPASDADQPQQSVADRVQSDDDRMEREPEALDDRRNIQRCVGGSLESERLWHHLANHDVEVCQHRDRDDAGERVRRYPPKLFEDLELWRDPDREGMLAVHSESETCDRNPDLGCGDITILPLRAREDPLDALRKAASLSGLVLDARTGRPHDRKLGGHE